MVALSDGDAVVIESLRHEFEEMGDFSPEGLDGKITVDPTAVLGEATDGDRNPSIFYWPVHGEFMDWGFRLSCAFRDAFPPEADPVATEFTPYTKLVIKRLVQTWAEIGVEQYSSPPDEGWISGHIMDTAAAKQARELYSELYDRQPPENYYSSLIDADDGVIEISMQARSDTFDSADDFRQRCSERETALYHIDYTESELTQLY